MAIKLSLDTAKIHLKVSGGSVQVQGDPYDGPYEVTPLVASDVVLETRKKLMRDDVTVRKIPQYEVSNDAGGYTLTIGEVI